MELDFLKLTGKPFEDISEYKKDDGKIKEASEKEINIFDAKNNKYNIDEIDTGDEFLAAFGGGDLSDEQILNIFNSVAGLDGNTKEMSEKELALLGDLGKDSKDKIVNNSDIEAYLELMDEAINNPHMLAELFEEAQLDKLDAESMSNEPLTEAGSTNEQSVIRMPEGYLVHDDGAILEKSTGKTLTVYKDIGSLKTDKDGNILNSNNEVLGKVVQLSQNESIYCLYENPDQKALPEGYMYDKDGNIIDTETGKKYKFSSPEYIEEQLRINTNYRKVVNDEGETEIYHFGQYMGKIIQNKDGEKIYCNSPSDSSDRYNTITENSNKLYINNPVSALKDDSRIQEKDGKKFVTVDAWSSKSNDNNCIERIVRNSYDLDALGIEYGTKEWNELLTKVMDANPQIYGDENGGWRNEVGGEGRVNAVIYTGEEFYLPDIKLDGEVNKDTNKQDTNQLELPEGYKYNDDGTVTNTQTGQTLSISSSGRESNHWGWSVDENNRIISNGVDIGELVTFTDPVTGVRKDVCCLNNDVQKNLPVGYRYDKDGNVVDENNRVYQVVASGGDDVKSRGFSIDYSTNTISTNDGKYGIRIPMDNGNYLYCLTLSNGLLNGYQYNDKGNIVDKETGKEFKPSDYLKEQIKIDPNYRKKENSRGEIEIYYFGQYYGKIIKGTDKDGNIIDLFCYEEKN